MPSRRRALLAVVAAAAAAAVVVPSGLHGPELPAAGAAVRPVAVRPTVMLLAPLVARVPARVGVVLTSAGRTVVLQRRAGTTWRTVARTTTDAGGRATLSWLPASAGRLELRAWAPSTRTHRAVVTAVVRVAVRRPPSGPVVPPSATGTVARVVAAAGQRMWLDCRGSGGPTVVLVPGVWGDTTDWARQLPSWRAGGRVCVYDRPGVGRSPARVGSRQIDAGVHAAELLALLRVARERGPFLLVGHSYGGLIVRAALAREPAAVAGIVLLDAVPPGFRQIYDGYDTAFDEGGATIGLDASSAATRGLRPLVGLPLVVVSAGRPITWAPSWVATEWKRQQAITARASDDSISLVATGALHQLQDYAPEVTARSVEVLRSSLRRHVVLPPCPGGWPTVGAACLPR